MKNENIINLGTTRDEAEELCYAIGEQEATLLYECKTSSDPWQRKFLRERYEIAHRLRIRLERALDEHPLPPIEVPSFGLNDMLAMVFPAMYRTPADGEPDEDTTQHGENENEGNA